MHSFCAPMCRTCSIEAERERTHAALRADADAAPAPALPAHLCCNAFECALKVAIFNAERVRVLENTGAPPIPLISVLTTTSGPPDAPFSHRVDVPPLASAPDTYVHKAGIMISLDHFGDDGTIEDGWEPNGAIPTGIVDGLAARVCALPGTTTLIDVMHTYNAEHNAILVIFCFFKEV